MQRDEIRLEILRILTPIAAAAQIRDPNELVKKAAILEAYVLDTSGGGQVQSAQAGKEALTSEVEVNTNKPGAEHTDKVSKPKARKSPAGK